MKEINDLYKGKELISDLRLGLYDYGARCYDPVICRWNGLNPLREKFSSCTPYRFVHNKTIKHIDPDDRLAIPPDVCYVRTNGTIEVKKKDTFDRFFREYTNDATALV